MKKTIKNNILIFDSGIGGLTILNKCIKEIPNANYIYFADFFSMPYGNKPVIFLRRNILQVLTPLIQKYNPQIVIIACNTATAVAINKIRAKFPDIIIIGTEPAINLAIKNNFKKPLLLATKNTIKYNRLIKNSKLNPDINLSTKIMPYLAKDIEDNIKNLEIPYKNLLHELQKIEDYDSLILGCTHYIFLKPLLKNFITVPIFDGNEGVVNFAKTKIIDTHQKTTLKILTNRLDKKDNLLNAWKILKKEF